MPCRVDSDRTTMLAMDTHLAGLLRRAQWACDEATFVVSGGEYSDRQKRELATVLDKLAAEVRKSTTPPAITGQA